MKAGEVVDHLCNDHSSTLVIVYNGDKRSARLGLLQNGKMVIKRIKLNVADCIIRNNSHQLTVCTTRPSKRSDAPFIVTVTKR